MRCNRCARNIVHLVGFRPRKRKRLRCQMEREKRATALPFSFICWSLDRNEGVGMDALSWRTRLARPAHYRHKHGANESAALMLRKHPPSSNLITEVTQKVSNSQKRSCLILCGFCYFLDLLVQTKHTWSNTLQLHSGDTRGQYCLQTQSCIPLQGCKFWLLGKQRQHEVLE